MLIARRLGTIVVLFLLLGHSTAFALTVELPITETPTNTPEIEASVGPLPTETATIDIQPSEPAPITATPTTEPTFDPCAPVEVAAEGECLPTETPTLEPTFDPCVEQPVEAGELICSTPTETPTVVETIDSSVTPDASATLSASFPTAISNPATIRAWTATTEASAVAGSTVTPAATEVTVTQLPNTGAGSSGGSSVWWLMLVIAALGTAVMMRIRRSMR